MMSSSDSFTNFETTIFFRETEFVYSFLCIVNINKNIYLPNFVGKISENLW